VAFDKGCYPGQEIVARSQYRGTVKRRLHRFASLQSTYPGAAMVAVDGSVGGMVVNAARTPTGAYELLAVVPQAGADGPLRLAQEGAPLQPLPLPYELPPTMARASHDGD
jgi:folate-binding Fe-S cluster repair protein YgfZ